eukprot:CAMPEP_0182423086 /NCGR_PEP_ID=MMETSP1167-20130531/9001_1 /TAXON_ID=2988 /ORGANISM="Mallomonas Sp, Strain CCMP3275" /LENGTH=555 /DNA_ID=CAMNT_0024601747 /DNA_START=73 /DNA_END=1740 /DNA_ORIENTATION=-
MSQKELNSNDNVEELRERMRLLQVDRKGNIEALETSKNVNKEEIKKLRDENSSLRSKLAQLQRAAVLEDENQEEKHMLKEVEKLRKTNDDLRLRVQRQHKELDRLKDSANDLELESQRPHMEDNQFTRRIRTLENKLDKAMIKYNEAQSIRKTYEQIVRRLKEERVGFDNQLSAVERTLNAKQRDYEELVLLSGDANHAKELAQTELDRVSAGFEEERKKRERELRERNQMVQLRRQMLDRAKNRERMRAKIAEQDAETRANNNAANAMTQKMIANERIEARNKIDIFENAFRKIKEATGVSDVNEVIQKIVSQEGTTENLIALTKENQSKIEDMNEQKRKLKAKVEEIKYSGVGGGHRRKMVDDFEDQLANSSARLERSRLKYERLNKSQIAMKAGVGHLQEKLDSVRAEVGGRRLDLTDDTIVDVMRESEVVLFNIIKRIKAGQDSLRKDRMVDLLDDQPSSPSVARPDSAVDIDEAELSSSRPYNQRIALNFEEYEDGGGGGGIYNNDMDDLADMDDDELTRDKVKRVSKQITEAIDKKKRKPRKKGERGEY